MTKKKDENKIEDQTLDNPDGSNNEDKPDNENGAEGDIQEALFPIEELAINNRIPTWQSAALSRLMGWENGKSVSEKEYTEALKRLKNRPIGG